jgi:hypothetical protein
MYVDISLCIGGVAETSDIKNTPVFRLLSFYQKRSFVISIFPGRRMIRFTNVFENYVHYIFMIYIHVDFHYLRNKFVLWVYTPD